MSVYDDHIKQIFDYLQERPKQEFDCPTSVHELRKGLPVQLGPGANSGIVLRSDTYAELGNPADGSTGFVIWTEDVSSVRDGRITLVGPDITQAEGSCLPFGQVLIMAGKHLNNEIQERIEEYQHISDSLEGYMVRTSSQNIWGRVSKDAVAKGFSLETLGRALMVAIKANVGEVEAMEVVFVTSTKKDIDQLDKIAAEVTDIRKSIIKAVWKERGYDLDCAVDCDSCDSKATCDDIRDMLLARKRLESLQTAKGGV